MAGSESQGFMREPPAPANPDFEETSPKPENIPRRAKVQDYDKKYPKRISFSLQSSSSELAIVSQRNDRKWPPKCGRISKHNAQETVTGGSSCSSRSKDATLAILSRNRPKTFVEIQPETLRRPTRLRQRHTFNSLLAASLIITGTQNVVRRQSQSLQSPRESQETFQLDSQPQPQDGGTCAEAIFRSRNSVGRPRKKFSTDALDNKDESEEKELADFCKLEELSKILVQDQDSEKPEVPKAESSEEAGAENIAAVPGNKVDAETSPDYSEHFSGRQNCASEKEWKLALGRIQQLEISKRICDAEIHALREDLSKASKIILEKSQLLERTKPKEGPPWVVPSEDTIVRPNIDYFSFRTVTETPPVPCAEAYFAKLYTPGGSVGSSKKENKVSFQLPGDDEKERLGRIELANCNTFRQIKKTRTNSAPSGKTYGNIRLRQMQLNGPVRKSLNVGLSKKPSLGCLRRKTVFAEQSFKARSVPLNSKLCTHKLETGNKGQAEENVPSYNGTIQSNPIANMEYLAIALASREGLIREIAHSVKKAKKILHFRFNMLVSSDFATEDLHFLLTSHRRFLRWLNNYINYSTNLINRFDDKYMKSRRFFLPATLELKRESLKGIFIPVPDHRGDSPAPEYVEKSVQTVPLKSVSVLHSPKYHEASMQTSNLQHLSEDKAVQVHTIPRALQNFQERCIPSKPFVRVADKSTLAHPAEAPAVETSTQTQPESRTHQSTQSLPPHITAARSVQTKRPPEVLHQSNQTPPSLISKNTKPQGNQTLEEPSCLGPSRQQAIKSSQTPLPPAPSLGSTQTTVLVASIETQSNVATNDSAINTFSVKSKKDVKFLEPGPILNSKSIQAVLMNENQNPKPVPSTRNVALQHFLCQTPPLPLSTAQAPTKFDVENQPGTGLQVDSTAKSKPRISFNNLLNLSATQEFTTAIAEHSPSVTVSKTSCCENVCTASSLEEVENAFLGKEDLSSELEDFQMEELWNVPTTATSSVFSETLGLLPEDTFMLPERGEPTFRDPYLEIYEPLDSNQSLKTPDIDQNEIPEKKGGDFVPQENMKNICDTVLDKDKNEIPDVDRLSLLQNVSEGMSPLNFVTEFHEEIAESLYRHRGNAHLRILDEGKILAESTMLRELEKPVKSVFKSMNAAPGSSIEELTSFFEETVAKFKQNKSVLNFEEPLPKFKSTAEVVIDILSEGPENLYEIDSNETLMEEDVGEVAEDLIAEKYAEILKNSEILEIDPEYEAMFDLALQENPNVEEEFERILNEQESVAKIEKPSTAGSEAPEEVGIVDIKSTVLETSPETARERCPRLDGAAAANDKSRSRVSRLPVRVSGPFLQNGSKNISRNSSRDRMPGIVDEPIPVQLKAKSHQALTEGSSGDVGNNGKSKGRRSLIPIKAKPTAPGSDSKNCPKLAQATVKRVPKVAAQPMPGIARKITSSTSKEGPVPVKRRVTSIEDRKPPTVGNNNRKSVSKILSTYRKAKVSSGPPLK